MTLDESQRQKVSNWIAAGANLATIQKQLASELGVNLTYMQVRLLVDDLKLTPKDAERARAIDLGTRNAAGSSSTASPETSNTRPSAVAADLPADTAAAGGKVAVKVDQLARPGAIVSGKVIFSDGKSADWYLDQMGRLGLSPAEKGYKPSPGDIQVFQMQLQDELAKLGF